jgi:hypothetical protein
MAMNHLETLKGLEEAMSTITMNMAYSQFYESMFAASNHTNDRLEASMGSALPEFYASVLVFSVKVKSYFSSAGLGETNRVP